MNTLNFVVKDYTQLSTYGADSDQVMCHPCQCYVADSGVLSTAYFALDAELFGQTFSEWQGEMLITPQPQIDKKTLSKLFKGIKL